MMFSMIAQVLAWAILIIGPNSYATDVVHPPVIKQEQKLDVAKGKSLYMANCIACHNKDPNKKGSLGPELTGTPLEVFKIKVVTGNQYPDGYVPKRKTKIMKKLPQLEKDIPNIHAWILSVTNPGTSK